MKKTIICLMLMCLGGVFTGQANEEIVFTTVLENGITPVKNQNRSV